MAQPRGIGIPFRFDATGYPASVTDSDLIHDSIYTILSTTVGERVHRPTFGCFLKYFVFAPLTRATVFRIQSEVRRAIRVWEKRVEVTEVKVENPEDSTLLVTVVWIANGTLKGSTSVPFTRNTEA